MRIPDAVFLVTGASRGIGAAVAAQLAARGAAVILHGRCVDRLDALAALLGAKALAIDLCRPGAAERLAGEAYEVYGRIDGVVHVAGVGWYGRADAMPPAKIDELTTVNLLAPLRLTRCVLPDMVRARRGHVAFVASIAGLTGVASEAVYSATKAGIVAFADSLRLELSGTGVSVSLVCPGAVDTEFCARRGTPYRRRVPRPVPAERVADAVVDGIARDRPAQVVPAWLRTAPAVQALAPPVYRVLARHFG